MPHNAKMDQSEASAYKSEASALTLLPRGEYRFANRLWQDYFGEMRLGVEVIIARLINHP